MISLAARLCRRCTSRSSGRGAIAWNAIVALTIVFLGARAATAADAPPQCAWPIEIDGAGASNVAHPDPNAAYWATPFDPSAWRKAIVRGRFPKARVMAFATYDAHGVERAGLLDLNIAPDQGSASPFRPGSASKAASARNYSISVGRERDDSHNHLGVPRQGLAWIVYRVYVPDGGADRKGGAPLPAITLVADDSRSKTIPACRPQPFPNAIAQAERTLRALGDSGASAADYLASASAPALAPGGVAEVDSGGCAAAPPPFHARVLPGLFHHDAIKTLVSGGICAAPNRIVVIRGKAPGFPDTHSGAPVSKPAPGAGPIAMRYWSMCDNLEYPPAPVGACQADWATRLDPNGYYTYVLAPGFSRPGWLAPDASFLPWNAAPQPNLLILRNLIPANSFTQSVQAVARHGCVVGGSGSRAVGATELKKAAACAEKIMGPYYPRAVYCDRQLYLQKGWRGCFAAAGVTPP